MGTSNTTTPDLYDQAITELLSRRGVDNKYRVPQEFFDDAFDILMLGPIFGKMTDGLIKLIKKAENSDIDIPFIKSIKKLHFELYEIYILLRTAYCSLVEHRSVLATDLIKELRGYNLNSWYNICSTFINENDHLFSSDLINTQVFILEGRRVMHILPTEQLLMMLTNTVSSSLPVKQDSPENTSVAVQEISPKYLYDYLNDYIVGQDIVKKNLSSAIYTHILRCNLNSEKIIDKLDKVNTLLIGNTGTGKTFICQTLAQKLKLPFYIGDASQLTSSGYVGLSVEDLLIGLKNKIPDMNDTVFPPSIIFIDEIDKIATKTGINSGNDIGGRKVQEELLKLVESDTYTVSGNMARGSSCTYDISNVLIIAGGAFSGMETIIQSRLSIPNKMNKCIGFVLTKEKTSTSGCESDVLKYIQPEDLIAYGLTPEFLGRFTNIAVLNNLSKENLLNILTNTKNNVIIQYIKLWGAAGIKLKFTSDVCKYIADRAYRKNIGARGLRNILNPILNAQLFDAKLHEKKQFTLTVKHLQLAGE